MKVGHGFLFFFWAYRVSGLLWCLITRGT